MRKKLLSMILCVLMVISFMPTTAFAESTTECTGESCNHEAAIGTTHYDTLAEAVTAATGSAINIMNDVKLTSDIDLTESKLVIPADKTVTLDLNGHTIHVANIVSSGIEVSGNLTLKDSTDTSKNGKGTGKIWTDTSYTGKATGYCLFVCMTMEALQWKVD